MKKFYESKIFIIASLFLIFGAVAVIASTIGDSGYSGIQVDNYFTGSGKQGITQNVSFNDSESNQYLLQFEDGLLVDYSLVEPTMPFPAEGLVAYYKLDESSGNAVDAFGSHDLVETGEVSSQTGLILDSRGTCSGSDYFNGTTNYPIDETTDFSVNLWIYKNSSLGSESIFLGIPGTVGHTFFNMRYRTDDKIDVFLGQTGSSSPSITSTDTMSLGEWKMVTFVYNSSATTGTLYIDGSSQGIVSQNYNPTADDNLYFGAELNGGAPLANAYLDEFGYWNKVLNSTEVEMLYNNGEGATYN